MNIKIILLIDKESKYRYNTKNKQIVIPNETKTKWVFQASPFIVKQDPELKIKQMLNVLMIKNTMALMRNRVRFFLIEELISILYNSRKELFKFIH